jgi:hypothetical protein
MVIFIAIILWFGGDWWLLVDGYIYLVLVIRLACMRSKIFFSQNLSLQRPHGNPQRSSRVRPVAVVMVQHRGDVSLFDFC